MTINFGDYDRNSLSSVEVSDLVSYIRGEYRNTPIPERFYVVVENPTKSQKLATHQYLELREKQHDN